MRYFLDLFHACATAYQFDSFYELAECPHSAPQSEVALITPADFSFSEELCPA